MIKTIGVLAHVDAGKTTFSERALFLFGAIRAPGRVDHGDAFLDDDPLERRRGITIFSGQARFTLDDDTIQWLDTPGHADFSPEMERALGMLDAAILLVSAVDGIASHTQTLWSLLDAYHVPTAIFLNKTDLATADAPGVLAELRREFSRDILDVRDWQTPALPESLYEEIAARDETLMEAYFARDLDDARFSDALSRLFMRRAVFPVFSGSALTGDGVEGCLRNVLAVTTPPYDENAPFSARVWQVRHDARGQRVVFLKLLSGALRVKDAIEIRDGYPKIHEIRLYHGARYQVADRAVAGQLIGVPGMDGARAGDIPGSSAQCARPFFARPMLEADVVWDARRTSLPTLLSALRALEEEEPTLSVSARNDGATLRVMGKIQLEVLKSVLHDRYGIDADFGPCRVLYQETIAAPCYGVGHYEPLRHYAEVHLRLIPAARGSGIAFRSACHVDVLSRNWQRLIEQHVLEKAHKGVLIGAPLTDVLVELVAGRAHVKHTEGGDFRQATYRAIRNALMYAESVLLEPLCAFRLRLPIECVPRLLGDLLRMHAKTDPPVFADTTATVTGTAVYALFLAYQEEFLSMTRGKGVFFCRPDHYAPCHDAQQVIANAQYNPLADDTPDSVFCERGAGFAVPWNEVRAHAHIPLSP